MPNSVAYLNWGPMFECCVDLRTDIKMCLEEIGLHAQDLLAILGSIGNWGGGVRKFHRLLLISHITFARNILTVENHGKQHILTI